MVSPVRRGSRTKWLDFGKRRFISRIILLAITLLVMMVGSLHAQIRNTRVEFASLDGDEVLFHVRVLRGQTIASASIVQGDKEIELEAGTLPMATTQYLILDAGEEMVNLQTTVQGAVQRFLRNNETPTGLIIFNSRVDTLSPTDSTSQIDSFLLDYTATAGEPACLADALTPVADAIRNFDRSWRILVITAGDFSSQTACSSTEIPQMPAPIDVIAVTEDENEVLQDLVESSGGSLIRANLRTVEARINEVRTQWGQPTYELRGAWSGDWDESSPLELTVALANETSETLTVRLQTYKTPQPVEPTIEPTDIPLATIAPQQTTEAQSATPVTATGTSDSDTSTPSDGAQNIAFLLIIGAVLFIIGAVILALALSRVRRPPQQPPRPASGNFYDTLDDEVEAGTTATKIRERNIVGSDGDDQTQLAPRSDSKKNVQDQLDETNLEDFLKQEADAEDDLIITQVLTDDRFRSMVAQSKETEEVIGWLRVEGASPGDYELTTRGAVIGRSQDCTIQIRGDGAISRQHARIEIQSDHSITVSRMSATNPVIVGGVQVGNRHELKTNDVIHLSDRTRIVFISKTDDLDEEVTRIK